MNLNQIHNIYFIGIGGIGMSALARYFMHLGKNVAGYDKTPTILTSELQAQGIKICFKDDVALIDKVFKNEENTLVVTTPAVPKSHQQWQFFISHDFEIKKRAEVLGIITQDTFSFAVAGTHGKTTTSSILGHILYHSNVDVTAFLGGIVEGYNSNLIGNGTSVSVVEADEFDRSFLHLYPNLACVTSIDADHLDVYGNANEIEASFREFAAKVLPENLFVPVDLPLKGNTVAINKPADYSVQNIRIKEGYYHFDIHTRVEIIPNVKFALPGHHNLSNALIAFAMAKKYGIATQKIIDALATFSGVRRRFSFQIRTESLVYIDDYAHHPTEIDAVHQAIRELYPEKKVLAVFQPHLYSRTQDFANEFAVSLSNFDTIFLLDIYPAREEAIEGVTSEWLLKKVKNQNKKLIKRETIIDEIKSQDFDVLVTLGAGDIGEMVKTIKEQLNETIKLA